MFKFCPNCGEKLPDNVKFCPHCGYQLPQHTQSTLPTQPTESSSEAQPTQPSMSEQPTQATQSASSTQPTQASQNSSNYNDEAYNGSGNPSLIVSSNLWIKTIFKTDQCMGRADFWWGYLGLTIASLVVSFVYHFIASFYASASIAMSGSDLYYGASPLYILITLVYIGCNIFIFVILVFAAVQRLHDTGHSGYNWLWCLTGVGVIYDIVLLTQPTDWSHTEYPRYHYEIKG